MTKSVKLGDRCPECGKVIVINDDHWRNTGEWREGEYGTLPVVEWKCPGMIDNDIKLTQEQFEYWWIESYIGEIRDLKRNGAYGYLDVYTNCMYIPFCAGKRSQ